MLPKILLTPGFLLFNPTTALLEMIAPLRGLDYWDDFLIITPFCFNGGALGLITTGFSKGLVGKTTLFRIIWSSLSTGIVFSITVAGFFYAASEF